MQILAFLRPEAEWSFFLFTKFSCFKREIFLLSKRGGGHFKPCPFGVELPNCTFLMELLKIVSLIHAGEDRWAGASAGALSLCYTSYGALCKCALGYYWWAAGALACFITTTGEGVGVLDSHNPVFSINWILIIEIVHAGHWASHFWKFRDFVRKTI